MGPLIKISPGSDDSLINGEARIFGLDKETDEGLVPMFCLNCFLNPDRQIYLSSLPVRVVLITTEVHINYV